MKQYMKVGERGYYDKKRYRCVRATFECEGCDLLFFVKTSKEICSRILCKKGERPDRESVIFRLQPKYRKEVKNG